MRQEIIRYIYSNQDLKRFLREQPQWYRKLARDPSSIEQFEVESLHYFEKTIPHRVSKFSNGLHMASMMLNLLQSTGSSQ